MELPISYVKKTTKGAADPRDGYFIQLPGRREVDVRHEQTGESRRMTFEWVALNQTVGISRGTLSNNHPLYNNYNALIGGCRGVGSLGQERPPVIRYFWRVVDPQSPQGCSSSNNYSPAGYVTDAIVEQMSAAFNLDIPPPYRLRAGVYRGSVTYSIGPGGDFDLGNDVSQLSGNNLTVNFELDVRHAFLFEFPPGSERAVLEPNGGWSAWLAGGRAPTTLYRDLPFRLWSTGPFKVYKLCEHTLDVRCAIVNDSSHQVPVEVALSLPGGMQYQGQPIERLALPSGRAAALQFDSVMPTLNRLGQLHFKVARADVPSMLAYSGSTYTGQVTVVFDAEL
ncbi:hypothetical protein [Pseudomonas kurunegalensis]|uniref:hypothetical protein n=1 Tax=Pseudomonas kurunegalensis TaxID=485880 RepID=UPI003B67596E